MIDILTPIMTFCFAVFFVFLSKSQKNYNSLLDSGGEKFALKITKSLKWGGLLLSVFSVLWLLFVLYLKK
ncbi:MAG: hypothetical protein ABIK15_08385 [Pseudomonadota bacterium]